MYLEEALVHLVACCNEENHKEYYSNDDSEDVSETEMESESKVEADEDILGHEADHIPNIEYDMEDSPTSVGTSYPSMKEFKLALSQHAIKYEFEYNAAKSVPHRKSGKHVQLVKILAIIGPAAKGVTQRILLLCLLITTPCNFCHKQSLMLPSLFMLM